MAEEAAQLTGSADYRNERKLPKIGSSHPREETRSVQADIDALPESILLQIFKTLEKVADRCAVARTCHSWNRIIQDAVLWKNYSLQETKLNYRTVRSLLSAGLGSSLLDLDLSISSGTYHPFPYVPQLWRSLSNLEKLRIGSIDIRLFDFALLPASLKSLTMYTMTQFEVESPARIKCSSPVLPNLEHLEIEDCEDVFANDTIEELHGLHFLMSSERLHTVSLKLMHFLFTKNSLSMISKRLKSVRHACLHCNSICDESFRVFASRLECVEVLNLQFTNIEAEVEDLTRAISRLKTLKSVYLSMFWELRPENVRAMVINLPKLTLVHIHRSRRIKEGDLAEIEKLRDGLKCQFPKHMTLSFY